LVTPDLVVQKGGTSILFEVKPLSRSHDLMLACGQVLAYNEEVKATQTVNVSEPSKFSAFGQLIARSMKKHNIHFIEYRNTGNGFVFPELKAFLSKSSR
jgi:hypothetical protein